MSNEITFAYLIVALDSIYKCFICHNLGFSIEKGLETIFDCLELLLTNLKNTPKGQHQSRKVHTGGKKTHTYSPTVSLQGAYNMHFCSPLGPAVEWEWRVSRLSIDTYSLFCSFKNHKHLKLPRTSFLNNSTTTKRTFTAFNTTDSYRFRTPKSKVDCFVYGWQTQYFSPHLASLCFPEDKESFSFIYVFRLVGFYWFITDETSVRTSGERIWCHLMRIQGQTCSPYQNKDFAVPSLLKTVSAQQATGTTYKTTLILAQWHQQKVHRALFQPCKITHHYFANLSVNLKMDTAKKKTKNNKTPPPFQLIAQRYSRYINNVPAMAVKHFKMWVTLIWRAAGFRRCCVWFAMHLLQVWG